MTLHEAIIGSTGAADPDRVERAVLAWLKEQREAIAQAVLDLSLATAVERGKPPRRRDYAPAADAVLRVLGVAA